MEIKYDKNEKMTLKQALFLCWKLWEWVVKTGLDKEDWPEWGHNGGEVNLCNSHCPCCEFTLENIRRCSICPIKGLWPRGTDDPCMKPGSVFLMFVESEDISVKKSCAKTIARFAKDAYDDMLERGE